MSQAIKLVVVGDGGVGKSTIVLQYVQNMFVSNYDVTVCKINFLFFLQIEDSFRKQDMIGDEQVVLEIFDCCHIQGEYNEQVMRNGHGFLICVSLTDHDSIEAAKSMIQQIERIKDIADNARVPMILVGTKSDLQNERKVTLGEMHALASKYDMPYIETSSKLNTNVKEAFHMIASIALGLQNCELVKKNNKGQKKDVICLLQ